MSEFDQRRRADAGTPAASGGAKASPLPGKQTLVSQLPVQQMAERSAATATDAVHTAADHGTSGPQERLPYLHSIQSLFGRHDVSSIKAHTDQAARESTDASGSTRVRARGHVAFAGTPGLHAAAHEAHDVQCLVHRASADHRE